MKKSYFVLLIFLSLCVTANAAILTVDTFDDYPNGTNLNGLLYGGTGWQPYDVGIDYSGVWTGTLSNVYDPDNPTIVTDGIAIVHSYPNPGHWTRLRGYVDTSLAGYSALVGTDGLIGTDAEIDAQTIYIGFIAGDLDGYAVMCNGGIELLQGETRSLLIGNAWGREVYCAYSEFGGGGVIGCTGFDLGDPVAEQDCLDNYAVTVDDQLHLFVVRIDYAISADDTITIWLDPDGGVAEGSQTCPDLTFNAQGQFDGIHLDGVGNGGIPPQNWEWKHDAIAVTTTFAEACNFTVGTRIRAMNPAPAYEENGVSTSADLSWEAPPDVTSPTYDVYLSTDPNLPTAGNQIANDITATTCDPGALNAASTYYWRVDVNSGSPVVGWVWTFETALPKALNPSPGDGDTNIARNATLSWDGGVDGDGNPPTAHRLYFDPNETLVATRDSGNVAVYVDLPPGTTTYDPDLAWDTQYFWIVDEVYTSETALGDLWDFTVDEELLCPSNDADVNDDCLINIEDLRLIVADWLDCTYTNDECP